jgi:hypothetical protein
MGGAKNSPNEENNHPSANPTAKMFCAEETTLVEFL